MMNTKRVQEESYIPIKVFRQWYTSCPFDVGGELVTHKYST